jgi:hypothetical protein
MHSHIGVPAAVDHGWTVVVSRLAAVLLLAAVTLGLATPAANAVPETKLDDTLAALWTTVLETPSAQNPFGTGGTAFACLDIGPRTVAPFGPSGAKSCTVKPGTKLFVAASSVECSTFEKNGTTEAELRNCARKGDMKVTPSVTVDGRSLPVIEVETRLLKIVLPENNIFDDPPKNPQPAGTTGLSVGHGWAVPLHPLTPGTHKIVIDGLIDDLGQPKPRITTDITVKPGHSDF